jgi:hypothetical protein
LLVEPEAVVDQGSDHLSLFCGAWRSKRVISPIRRARGRGPPSRRSGV